VDFRYRGTRHRKRSPLNTRGGALEFEATLRGRLARGAPLEEAQPAEVLSFGAFASHWVETYVRTNNKASEIHAKEGILRRLLLPHFGHLSLDAITAETIETYKAKAIARGFSPKSVNNQLTVLGKCLASAVEWRALALRPRIKLLRVPPSKFDTVDERESAALLRDEAEPVWDAMLRLALRTGMRPSELTSLTWSDVDLVRGTVTVRRSRWRGIVDSPKNNRARCLPLSDDARAAFHHLNREHELVFCQADGQAFTDKMRICALLRLCKRTGVRSVNWYAFRHTFASRLTDAGVPLPVVQQLMGHATIAMTMRYTHTSSQALFDAVALLERSEHEAPAGNRWSTRRRSPPSTSGDAAPS